ncbi:MAG TPA: MFS transporter [Solirubrobacteraceae bacterium]|nr:MFS transporter [Solirubrobacteraceae bacterium]
MQDFLRALKVPSFARLAVTYALNELADWCASIALAVLVYAATEDALGTTALFVVNRFLPAFIVPALAARLEALPTARTLASLYVLEAILLAGLALSTIEFVLPLVLVLACLDGTVAATARAMTRSATVALMEPKGLLREGNATMNLSFSSMNAGAPVLAGVLVASAGEAAVLAVAAALFLAQAVAILGARDLPAGEPEPAPWAEKLREGLAYVKGHPFLRTMFGGQAVAIVLLMMIPPIEVVYAKESLDAGDVGYGVLLASWGVGMVLGSLLFARERERPILVLVAVGTGLQGFAYLGMAASPVLALACTAAFVGGLGNGMQWVAVVTAVQEATEERFQSRIAGLMEALVTGAPGIGFILGGAITSAFDPRVALLVSGAGVLLVVAVGALALGTKGMRELGARSAEEPAVPAVPVGPGGTPEPAVAGESRG